MGTEVEHRAETALQPAQLQLQLQLQLCSHSTMKVLAPALVALLLVATCSLSEAHLDGVPLSCCFSYQQQPIPLRLISSVYRTSSSCTLPAVIMVTKKGKQLCTDPEADWVKMRLKHFQPPKN